MELINKEALLQWIDNEIKNERSLLPLRGKESDTPFTKGKLAAMHDFKLYVKAMPPVESPEKVLAEIKAFDEKTVSRMIKDLLAEHEATKEHEHDYFLASISSDSYSSLNEGYYRKATLVCRKCGEAKTIHVVKNEL